MSTITLSLTDHQMLQLRDEAARAGLTVEEFASAKFAKALEEADAFRRSANYVLEKNAELYRRLA